MRRLNALLYQGLRLALTLLMILLVVPIVLQIVSRFSPAIPHFIWTEEVARFCFIWVIMIGAMIAVRDDTHFSLDIWKPAENPRTRALQGLWVHVAMLLLALIFAGFGVRFAQFGYAQSSELTGLNMLAVHAAWPLAGVVFILFLTEKIADDVALMKRHPHGRR